MQNVVHPLTRHHHRRIRRHRLNTPPSAGHINSQKLLQPLLPHPIRHRNRRHHDRCSRTLSNPHHQDERSDQQADAEQVEHLNARHPGNDERQQ